MKKYWLVAILSLAFAVSGFMPAQTTGRPEVLLDAAKKKELLSGDLDAAIRQYRDIVAKHPNNHAVAAEALLRMAQCYEKQGAVQAQEAQRAYERIVRDYADQKEAFAEAQKHLRAGGDADVELRQILSARDGRSYGLSVSRDGRYLAFALRGISLYDLRTRAAQVLIPAVSNEERHFAPMISPDGKQITFVRATPQGSTLDVVNADGANQRTLGKGALPCSWSPDGRHVLALGNAAGQNQFQLITIADGSSRTIAEGRFSCGRISPDGRQIAYEKSSTPASGTVGGIYLMHLEGGHELPLSQDADAFNPLWTPDGQRVLFSRNRQGVGNTSPAGNDLWGIRVMNGKPVGAAEVVRKNVPALLGVSQNGEYFFHSDSVTRDLYTIDIDPKTGQAGSGAKQITSHYDNRGAAWSPDGKYLAYFSIRQGNEMAVVIRSATTGEERVLSPNPSRVSLGFKPEWFPDSRSLLLLYGNGKLARLNVETGEFRALLESVSIKRVSATSYPQTMILCPDGSSILYLERHDDTRQIGIVRQNLEGGAAREICRVDADNVSGFSLSADGGRLAFTAVTGGSRPRDSEFVIMTVATDGGKPREVYRRRGWPIRDILWNKDGRRLFFTSNVNRFVGQDVLAVGGDIYSVSADRGEAEPLKIGLQDEYFLGMHPDGRQLIFMDENYRNELWVMKNLVLASKASR